MQNTKSLVELLALSLLVFKDEKHAKVNTVYAAEDGNVFIDENRAKLHVKVKELKYHTITRTEAEGTEEKQTGGETDEATFLAKTNELQELELVTANYQKMKALALFFKLETADQKADTLISALTEYKSKISE